MLSLSFQRLRMASFLIIIPNSALLLVFRIPSVQLIKPLKPKRLQDVHSTWSFSTSTIRFHNSTRSLIAVVIWFLCLLFCAARNIMCNVKPDDFRIWQAIQVRKMSAMFFQFCFLFWLVRCFCIFFCCNFWLLLFFTLFRHTYQL